MVVSTNVCNFQCRLLTIHSYNFNSNTTCVSSLSLCCIVNSLLFTPVTNLAHDVSETSDGVNHTEMIPDYLI